MIETTPRETRPGVEVPEEDRAGGAEDEDRRREADDARQVVARDGVLDLRDAEGLGKTLEEEQRDDDDGGEREPVEKAVLPAGQGNDVVLDHDIECGEDGEHDSENADPGQPAELGLRLARRLPRGRLLERLLDILVPAESLRRGLLRLRHAPGTMQALCARTRRPAANRESGIGIVYCFPVTDPALTLKEKRGPGRSGEPESGRREEGRGGADRPERAADSRGPRHREAADRIVEADRAAARSRVGEIHDEGLARRLADLPQVRRSRRRRSSAGNEREKKHGQREEQRRRHTSAERTISSRRARPGPRRAGRRRSPCPSGRTSGARSGRAKSSRPRSPRSRERHRASPRRTGSDSRRSGAAGAPAGSLRFPLSLGEGRGEGATVATVSSFSSRSPRRSARSIAIESGSKRRIPRCMPCLIPSLSRSHASQRRSEHDRNPLQDRLYGEAGDPPASLDLLADEREGRGQSERLPAQDEEKPEEDARNRRTEEIGGEAGGREGAEEQERAAGCRACRRARRRDTRKPRRGDPSPFRKGPRRRRMPPARAGTRAGSGTRAPRRSRRRGDPRQRAHAALQPEPPAPGAERGASHLCHISADIFLCQLIGSSGADRVGPITRRLSPRRPAASYSSIRRFDGPSFGVILAGLAPCEEMNADLTERRKGPRRYGAGRRIYGDRREPDQPDMTLPGWKPRQGQRRAQKRRSLPDRRRSPN